MCSFCKKTFKIPPLVEACPESLIGIENIDFIKNYFNKKKYNSRFRFKERAKNLLAKKIYHRLSKCGLTINHMDEETGCLCYRYVPSKRLPNGKWDQERNLCPTKEIQSWGKVDPDYKAKIHLLMLRTDHKISQAELERKMAEFKKDEWAVLEKAKTSKEEIPF